MQIAILLYEGMTALDAIGPYEVLRLLPGTTVHFVAETPGPTRTDSGFLSLVADAALSEVAQPDIVLLPGGPGTFAAAGNEHILNWLRTAHATTRWTTSVCTGSLILGAAGLLQGLHATTHWLLHAALEGFGATYTPERYVQQGKIITAAGVSAGIDMALFLASEIAGVETAQAIQLAVEYAPHPPFNTGSPQQASPEIIELAQHLLSGNNNNE